jgi:cytoskeletal protein RodZ
MISVGDYLKKEREARHLDLRAVAELTKISERYLSCIESGDYDQLPPGPYAKGYIAAYARQVCGDETRALALYAGSRACARQPNPGAQADSQAPRPVAQGRLEPDDAGSKRPAGAFWRTILAVGMSLTRTLRRLLPDGGNLRHLSQRGAAEKSAFAAKITSLAGALARLTAKLGELPKALILKCVLASGILLVGVAILVLAGVGAYHLFVFEGEAPPAHQVEVSTARPPASDAAAPPKAAVPPSADRSTANQPFENVAESAKSPRPSAVEASAAEKPPSPAAKAETEPDAIAQKTPNPDLKPKPSTPVVVQTPAESRQDSLSAAADSPGTKAFELPLTLFKASVCTAVEDHMPVGVGDRFPWTTPRIFVWSLLGASDPPEKVHHIYYFEGHQVSDVTLKVGSSYWRTWSFHTLSGQLHIGAWQVDITTDGGRVLRRLHFVIE